MVVKSELKLIKSLQQKKYRNEHGLFVVEGKKGLRELLESSLKPFRVYVSNALDLDIAPEVAQLISPNELQRMSSLKNANGALGVFHIPKPKHVDFTGWLLALDGIQDPGNLGTIIRLCDWFGITNLICSKDTVDCYNPKVLQATMGSIARVNIVYSDIKVFLENSPLPIYGTFMDGISIYKTDFPSSGILIMGNEGNGISNTVEKLCSYNITIPQFGKESTESLNVGTASAILLNEIRRKVSS